MSSIEDNGIYNHAVKEQVRKDKFGKDILSFMILGNQDWKKTGFFLKHRFMAFLTQIVWLGLESQDFKEVNIKNDMAIDVDFTFALFLDN